ncbi:mitochondrial inner membrane protein OXA1-like [Lotus japonicus]|uniref:mitochondrial inner membrane protein OXA1-like n=1 Tax=Lotus japonicus TaxID=34305 RepID=UPI00258A907E|nr:mitochondrial inner membrane protein OXA1-like [Lotus japonicus]
MKGSSVNSKMKNQFQLALETSTQCPLGGATLTDHRGFSRRCTLDTISAGSDEISIMTDVADILTDVTMEGVASQSQAPVVSEVAIAAADSCLPVQIAEYVIDAVHSYTGLNWWAAIVLTTLLIQSATVPVLIYLLKAASKLTMMRPHLQELMQQMERKAIFCYWLTSNLLTLIYGLVLQDPGVKKALGVPEIPAAPPTSPPQSTTSTKKL